ncbi:MAG: phospholipase D family protein [Cytophagales bacterium]|nr:phospholipase D family protein [Cytophagales bacterium]
MKYPTPRLVLPALLVSVLLFRCSSDAPLPSIDQDFCAQIHMDSVPKLSEQLASLDSLTASRTGVYTLEEGDISMIARAWLCESAEKSIDVQYFIFSADNVGLIAIDYLLRAADRGVKVRMLVDDILVKTDAEDLLALDAHPNLSIRIYNPTANVGKNLPEKLISLTTDFKDFNQRMHNKTFTVDGKVVITGGRNIADEYFDYDHTYNFRDRDVMLIGKTVRTVQRSFEEFWNHPLSVPLKGMLDKKDLNLNAASKYEYIHQYACDPANFWPQVRDKIRGMPIAFQRIKDSGQLVWVDSVSFISDRPGKNDARGLSGGGVTTAFLMNLVRNAKKSIHIQTPYLVTMDASRQLFADAVSRGVDVKILTNSMSSTDNLEAFSGYKRDRDKLLAAGVDIYEFRPDAAIRFKVMTGALQKVIDFTPIFGLHAKSMVIDEAIAVIGTFNLDPRSANLNTECVAAIYDENIARNLFRAMDEDMKPENAWQTTRTYNPDGEAGWWKNLKVWSRGIVPKSVL